MAPKGNKLRGIKPKIDPNLVLTDEDYVRENFKGSPNKTQEEVKFTKSNANPRFEEFETMVDKVRKEVRKTVDYRKSIKDDSKLSIMKYTDETIKRVLRASRWA